VILGFQVLTSIVLAGGEDERGEIGRVGGGWRIEGGKRLEKRNIEGGRLGKVEGRSRGGRWRSGEGWRSRGKNGLEKGKT
jgi:hypothetical protein